MYSIIFNVVNFKQVPRPFHGQCGESECGQCGKSVVIPHSAVFGAHVWIEYKQGTSREFLEHFIAHVI